MALKDKWQDLIDGASEVKAQPINDIASSVIELEEKISEDPEKIVSIDLSNFDSNGQIVETYSSGATKTTTVEFDEDGNPTKITDDDGNEITLTW